MIYCMYTPEHSGAAYPDPFELFSDAAALIQEEVRVLAAEGCTYIQIDAPDLGDLVDESLRQHWASFGNSPDRAFTDGLDLINSVAQGVDGVQFSMHVCRGNYQSRWIGTGGYEAISSAVFERCTNFDKFLLEYDDPRAGTFEPLVDLPDDKVAALGLISTKHGDLESVDALLARIEDAARFHPIDQLAICTQCGFASVAMGNEISERAQEQKLRLVAERPGECGGTANRRGRCAGCSLTRPWQRCIATRSWPRNRRPLPRDRDVVHGTGDLVADPPCSQITRDSLGFALRRRSVGRP